MSEREPGDAAGEQAGRDPVNHQPPEEWRPGDPPDPMAGGVQPPGEPPHRHPHEQPPGRHAAGAHPYRGDSGGAGPSGEHPTGAPPEPVTGQVSEGPSGPAQAGYEHAGYPPGYGESDASDTGPGGYPPGGPPANFSSGQGPSYAEAGGRPSGQGPGFAPPGGYGQPYGQQPGGGQAYPPQGGYGPPEVRPTPWGKILGIGCGVLLVLLLLAGGCTTLALFTAGSGGSAAREEGSAPLPETQAEVTAAATEFEPGPLYEEGDFTSVAVSVTNTGREDVDVNPLYFRVVDTEGVEHSTSEAIGMDANEIGARSLAPGQSLSGVVTVEGEVRARTVVFEPAYSGPVEARVIT
ncbi:MULTISPECIES: DUF4352 domain-containing protein [unclassified Nocardiopsis]|uniref:DUF4352 domain-containing protein n=1 Tax=unclassified Nocardiopsis TaxID=2649073 RepID=UPI001F2CF39B|nr:MULTISPECIES: DUF4352 domain-containing protein [unclassified Nocardiopsis]